MVRDVAEASSMSGRGGDQPPFAPHAPEWSGPPCALPQRPRLLPEWTRIVCSALVAEPPLVVFRKVVAL
ncbi:hypothetical protein CEXT_43031 [Caerostris extrusa]|uniref:Uncharacterized protein n=1 Tax=Caerostris extrusa TaxID=172846 RepID=A0AAV4WLN5_CAEEX|nr:hypothetical protein CEXT_43031 [Caerostris extrusa]